MDRRQCSARKSPGTALTSTNTASVNDATLSAPSNSKGTWPRSANFPHPLQALRWCPLNHRRTCGARARTSPNATVPVRDGRGVATRHAETRESVVAGGRDARLVCGDMESVVLRVRLISGDSVDVTYEEREAGSEAEVIDHVVSTLSEDSGVLRCKHGQRLVVLYGRGVAAVEVAPRGAVL
jgi:hypothetical protein